MAMFDVRGFRGFHVRERGSCQTARFAKPRNTCTSSRTARGIGNFQCSGFGGCICLLLP